MVDSTSMAIIGMQGLIAVMAMVWLPRINKEIRTIAIFIGLIPSLISMVMSQIVEDRIVSGYYLSTHYLAFSLICFIHGPLVSVIGDMYLNKLKLKTLQKNSGD